MKAIAELEAAIDALPTKRLKVSRMQHLHLYAAGFIDYDGRRLVGADVLAWALERYQEKR